MSIVDKLTAVDMEAAVSAGGLAEAMARTANSARLAGVDMNQLIGYMAAVGEVTQRDMSTVGEAFKTIFARYGNVKLGVLVDEESGESLNDFETALNAVGISLRNQEGQFRDFNEVMLELSERYKTLSETEKSAIATTLGGIRQRENVLVLIENMGKAMQYAETAANSSGTALNKFAVYEESVEAKTNRATAAFENFSMTLLDSGIIGGIMDFGTVLFNVLSAFDAWPAKIAIIVAGFTAFKGVLAGLKTSKLLVPIIASFKDLFATISLLPAALSAAARGSMTLSDALSAININPVVLGITILIAVIGGAVALYKHFNVTIDEHIEKLHELDSEYSSNESTLSSLEEELETASSRMRELSEIDSPTLIEQGEMAKLKETCSDLEREIELLKQRNAEIEKQRSDNASAAWDQMNRVSYSSPWRADYEVTMYDPYMGSYQERMSAVQYAGYAMEQIRDIESQIQELELDGLTPDEQKEKEKLDNLVQNYKTALEEIRDDAVAVGTDASNALADKIMTFFNVDYGYKKIAETVPDVVDQSARQIESAVKNNLSSSSDDVTDILEALNKSEPFKEWVNSAIELGVITDDSAESVWGLVKAAVAAGQQNGIESLSEDAKTLYAHLKSLSGVQSNFESLSKALKEFSDDGIIASDTLEDLAKAFGGDTEAFQNFVNVAGDSSSTFSEVQAACNRLAESWVNSSDFLSNLTEETAAMTVAQLKNIGVTNAQEVVESKLAVALWNSADASDAAAQAELRKTAETINAKVASAGLAEAEWDKVKAFLEAAGASAKEVSALKLLRAETYNNKLTAADFVTAHSSVISSMLTAAKAAGAEAKSIEALNKIYALKQSWENGTYKPNSYSSKYSSNIKSGLGLFESSLSGQIQKDYYNVKYQEELAKYVQEAQIDISDITVTLPDITVIPTKSSSSSSKEIENYTVDIENFREALEDLADTEEKIATSEVKLDLIPDDDIEGKTKAILGIIDLYGLAQANLHDLNTERDNYLLETQKKLEAQGFSVEYDPVTNDFFVKNPEHINDLKAYKNGVFDQEATNEMRKEYAELIKNANEYNQANIDGSLKWWEYEKKKRSYLEDIHQYRMDAIEDEKDAIESLLDLTIDMIKQEKNDEIDALEEQRDIYADIINQRKEMLQLIDRERTYQQDLADKTSELSKLQARADTLQLAADSGDRNAALELGSVREEIAEKQREINDLQHDHYIETTEDALDTELENFDNQQDTKIKEIQDFLNDNEKLQQAALTRLDTMNSELFADLRRYAVKYTSTTGADLQNMWDNAFKAAERYGNFTNAMSTLSTESGVDKEAQASSIVAQMKYNGQQWHTASAAQQQKLQNDNVKLAADLSQLLGTPVTIKNGVWWINGKKLFEVYHTGTASVGGIPTLQQNEMWAKLQKGEMVLNQSQQDGLWNILSNMNPAKMLDKLLSPLASLNNLNFAPADGPNITIDASINIDGTLPDEQILSVIKKQPRVIGNAIAEQFGISGWKWRG